MWLLGSIQSGSVPCKWGERGGHPGPGEQWEETPREGWEEMGNQAERTPGEKWEEIEEHGEVAPREG